MARSFIKKQCSPGVACVRLWQKHLPRASGLLQDETFCQTGNGETSLCPNQVHVIQAQFYYILFDVAEALFDKINCMSLL